MSYLLWLMLMFGPKHYPTYYLPPPYVQQAPIVQHSETMQVAGPGVVDTHCAVTVIGKGQTLTVCR